MQVVAEMALKGIRAKAQVGLALALQVTARKCGLGEALESLRLCASLAFSERPRELKLLCFTQGLAIEHALSIITVV